MNKEDIRRLLRRYTYINDAMTKNLPAALFSASGKQKQIAIDKTIVKFVFAVQRALLSLCDFDRFLIEQFLSGQKDVYIYTHNELSKNSYYRIKREFFAKVYELCIYARLVSLQEITEAK